MPDTFGLFETIAVFRSRPIFLDQHLNRLDDGLRLISLAASSYRRSDAKARLENTAKEIEQGVLKLAVTKNAAEITTRENPYQEESYQKGFQLSFSSVFRKEDDPMVYVKSMERSFLNEEREIAKIQGYDEVIFLNRKEEISEGSVSNIFCVKGSHVFTPPVSSGLLNGILRQYLLSTYDNITESALRKEDLFFADEVFLTNSLMGIMPVVAVDGIVKKDHSIANQFQKQYLRNLSVL